MQLDIRTSGIIYRVNVLNKIDTVIHICKVAEGSWSVRRGPFTINLKYTDGAVKISYVMHGALVTEGMCRYDLYANDLVDLKILVKVVGGYELYPQLRSSIDALDYLAYRS